MIVVYCFLAVSVFLNFLVIPKWRKALRARDEIRRQRNLIVKLAVWRCPQQAVPRPRTPQRSPTRANR